MSDQVTVLIPPVLPTWWQRLVAVRCALRGHRWSYRAPAVDRCSCGTVRKTVDMRRRGGYGFGVPVCAFQRDYQAAAGDDGATRLECHRQLGLYLGPVEPSSLDATLDYITPPSVLEYWGTEHDHHGDDDHPDDDPDPKRHLRVIK